MALIVSLETSTTVCSAALHDSGKFLASSEIHIQQAASSRLAVAIEELFTFNNTNRSRVAAVAVSGGPGSYTGLRIGVATAKGLCYGWNVPLISVDTLKLLAYQVSKEYGVQTLLCPMLDARRMEVYCTLMDAEHNVLEPTAARVLDETSYGSWLDKGVVTFFGNGAAKFRNVIRHPNARFLEEVYPTARALGETASLKFAAGEFEDLSAYEPAYLKDFMVNKPKAA